MYNKSEYEALMETLSTTDQLLQPKDNVKRILGFYMVEPDRAINNHINNMAETYGKDRVFQIIMRMIDTGEL
jgi:hypothetical protein